MASTMMGKTCVLPMKAMASSRRTCPTVAPAAPSSKATFMARNVSSAHRALEVATRAVAASEATSDFLDAPISPYNGEPKWYALVARAEFFFNDVQNEALAEQLRELKRYYEESDREIDFFFVSEPAWLDKFPQTKAVKRPAVALISTDKQWITFMKLRLDRVLKIDLGNMNVDDATKSTGPVPEFKSSQKWTAPYTPYAPGWWEIFMRK